MIVEGDRRISPVSQSNTIIDERAVVIEIGNTTIADSAMLCTKWTETSAAVTQTGQYDVSFFPLVEVRYLFYRSVIGIAVLGNVSGISSVRDYPRDPHQDVPVNKTVVTAAKKIPRDGDAFQQVHRISPQQNGAHEQ